MRRPAVKIFIPDALKSILVDDWEKVTKENKVAPTPAPISVTQFLNEYEESEMAHRRPGSADADILEEVIAGVKEYFNKALGRILLYRFERNQYFDWHKQLEKGHGEHAGKTLCDIYGCEHLLRLFGKILPAIRDVPKPIFFLTTPTVAMPDLVAHTNMDAQAVSRLREELSKMTQWLAKRIERYLSIDYEHAGQDYVESSKGVA
jgi:mortality factor 4-like protein 1